MKIDKRRHLRFLKQKIVQLNDMFIRELKYGRRSLQYIRDLNSVIGTLWNEIRSLERDDEQRNSRPLNRNTINFPNYTR